MSGEYENVRRIVYGGGDDHWSQYYDGATFVPVCTQCGRFVKADATMRFKADTIADGPNATCAKCGRVEMLFEGFLEGNAG